LEYQWRRRPGTEGDFADIDGANSNTYQVRIGDAGHQIGLRVRRTLHNGEVFGSTEGTVPQPTISGTPGISREGDTLRAIIDGQFAVTGEGTPIYTWRRGSAADAVDDIVGSDSAIYELGTADSGMFLTVTVGRQGYLGTSSPSAAFRILNEGGNFVVSFSPDIEIGEGCVSFRLVESRAQPPRRTVTGLDAFEGDVIWLVGGWDIGMNEDAVQGERKQTLVLNAEVHNNRIGTHQITAQVWIGDVPYSRVITVTVRP
jgi:hypothetical protein